MTDTMIATYDVVDRDVFGALVEHAACEVCSQPVNDQGLGPSKGWVHTITGRYRCGTSSSDEMVSYAYGITEDAIETRIDKAVAEVEETTREAVTKTMFSDEQVDEAKLESERSVYDHVVRCFTDAMADVLDTATADELRAALDVAWEDMGERP